MCLLSYALNCIICAPLDLLGCACLLVQVLSGLATGHLHTHLQVWVLSAAIAELSAQAWQYYIFSAAVLHFQ